MKYIRTKDGIYKTRQCYPEETLFENVTYVYRHEFVKNKDILKKADTIKELCDGFIIGETLKIYNKSNFDFEKKIVNLGHKEYYKFENLKSICGVIMTFENGIPRIITVAKMNDKGELELL